MKYISIDLETTGLNPLTTDILEIGAYVEDTDQPLRREQLPAFHSYIWKDNYRGEPYALAMNVRIFEKILELKKTGSPLLAYPEEVVSLFTRFVYQNGIEKVVPAGKNFASFDLPFLKQLPNWNSVRMHHRALDPMMYYLDLSVDAVPSDMSTCKKRAGLPELVTHEALDDAWDVVSLLRHKYPNI